MKLPAALLLIAAGAAAQSPQPITLADAQRLALENHPALAAARLGARALAERVPQAAAARLPVAAAAVTGAGAPEGDRIAAGAINNPVVYSRLAMGVSVSQLVADFGRTDSLVASAKLTAEAEEARVRATRADILINVQRAYFSLLRARAVVGIARATVDARQLLVDQVAALVRSQLKSGLDLGFANSNLAEAKLLLVAAENEFSAAEAQLSEAIGYTGVRDFDPAEVPLPSDAGLDRDGLTRQALRDRPELAASRLDSDAARRAALAENALKYPTVSAIAAAGVAPVHVKNISTEYVAGGVSVTLPFLNGGLFKARQREAEARAGQSQRRVQVLENAVAREVAVALLDVTTAKQRIEVTGQWIAQAAQALELAQSRYELGLSSIVELSQAQLARTNAEIQQTTARYDYQLRLAILDSRTGRLQ